MGAVGVVGRLHIDSYVSKRAPPLRPPPRVHSCHVFETQPSSVVRLGGHNSAFLHSSDNRLVWYVQPISALFFVSGIHGCTPAFEDEVLKLESDSE